MHSQYQCTSPTPFPFIIHLSHFPSDSTKSYGNCLLDSRLRTRSDKNTNCAHKVQVNEPQPWNNGYSVTNASTCVIKLLRQYGEPTAARTIVAYACRSLSLCDYAVISTKGYANGHIRSGHRLSHAAVGTACIVESYLQRPQRRIITYLAKAGSHLRDF